MKQAARGLLLFALCAEAHAWTVIAAGLGGWTSKQLTVQYNFTDCPLPEATMLTVLDRSIEVFNGSRESGLQLVRASSAVASTVAQVANGTAPLTPLVLCDLNFTASQAVDGDFIPAVTRLGSTASRVSFAGVILNAEAGKNAVISNLSTDRLVVALSHEMGHALGLGHSSTQTSLMYYSISAKDSAVLTQDDMDGVSYLYPRDELSGGFYGCANAHRPRSSANALWIFVMVAVNLALGRAWFRPLRSERLL